MQTGPFPPTLSCRQAPCRLTARADDQQPGSSLTWRSHLQPSGFCPCACAGGLASSHGRHLPGRCPALLQCCPAPPQGHSLSALCLGQAACCCAWAVGQQWKSGWGDRHHCAVYRKGCLRAQDAVESEAASWCPQIPLLCRDATAKHKEVRWPSQQSLTETFAAT